MEEPVATPSSELLAADIAMRAAAAAADRWLDHYRRVASETVSEPQLDELLREALASIARLLRSDAVSLLLANDEGTELISRAAFGLTREVDLSVSIPAGAGVSGGVLATGQPRFIDDLRETEVLSEVLRSSDQRSYVGVALSAGGRTVGVLHATRGRVAPFEDDDARMLMHFAAPLAAAIERVELFKTEREARRQAEEATAEARRSAERVRGLQGVTAALAGAATVSEICHIIISHAVEGTTEGGVRAIWMRFDERLVLVGGVGASGDYPEIPLDQSLPAKESLEQGGPLFVETREEILRRWPVLASEPTTAFAVLPLIVQGRPLGIMAVGYRADHSFEPEEREYLTSIAEQAAIALARVEAQTALEEARRVAEERREQLRFLAEASDLFNRSLDLDVTMKTVAALGVPRLTDRCALYLVDPIHPTRVEKRVIGPPLSHDEWELFERSGATVTTLGAVGTVIQTGVPQHIEDLNDSLLAAAAESPEQLELLVRVGFGGILLLPLRTRGRILGALAFVNRRGRAMDPETVSLAEELAARAAVAIDNALMYGREAHIARLLIDSLLPSRLPNVPGLDIAVHYQPGSQGLEVGGDFYDVIALDDDACLVVVGDVQGKGVEAAAVTGIARTTIKAATRFETSPAAVLGHLNATLIQHIVDRAPDEAHPWDSARLCTAAVVRLVRRRHKPGWRATVASAGHPLALVRRHDGTVVQVGRPALMLGVEANPTYKESIVALAPGSKIVLFTDGVTDGDPGRGPLGTDGVAALLGEADGSAAEVTTRIAQAAMRGVSIHDDLVVLTVGVQPPN